MSVAIPKVCVELGSVMLLPADVLELRVHLGCTKEVSSFECLLQNFDEKYSSGGTNPINVGDSAAISIGRGTNCPWILTGRVEEVEPESTPVENYIRVRGRCSGEKIFRRVVTKIYTNKKGEEVVKDLIDNFTDLSHTRNSTELVEDTDTTYTLLHYEDTPVFDILRYIAESADKAGVIGFDFRVEWDGKFAFFARDTKTSPVSLSEKIEYSRYSKDIHRIRNKIKVYGFPGIKLPSDEDTYTDFSDPASHNWNSESGSGSISADSSEKKQGSYSVKHHMTVAGVENKFSFDYYSEESEYIDAKWKTEFRRLDVWVRCSVDCDIVTNGFWVQLLDKDGHNMNYKLEGPKANTWRHFSLPLGPRAQGWYGMSAFDWDKIAKIQFIFYHASAASDAWADWLFFSEKRYRGSAEDSASQSTYGLRELVEIDEELYSNNECELRADALLDHLSQPAEFITLRTTCLDYGTDRLLPGDKIHVTLPNENIDADYRIISVEYRVTARDQTLEITLELGKEKPLLADYLYGLRSGAPTLERLARTKAGVR